MKLRRLTNSSRKEKRVIKRWRLARSTNEEVKVRYQEALEAEVLYTLTPHVSLYLKIQGRRQGGGQFFSSQCSIKPLIASQFLA